MYLHQIKNHSLIYLERYVDQKEYTQFSAYNEASPQFQPDIGEDEIELPMIQLPIAEVKIELADPHYHLKEFYVNSSFVRFAIHPDIYYSSRFRSPFLIQYRHSYQPEFITVQPTASTRTLLASQPHPHYIKVHLPIRISRFNRRLRDVGIRNSLAVSRDLLAMEFPPFFGILPERIGIWHHFSKWGFIIRDFTPWPISDNKSFMIPYFSLFSRDIYNPSHEPLLIQLIRKIDAHPEEYLLEKVLKPLIMSWSFVALNRGILLAPHGQNILLELNKNMQPTRVIHRDFLGLDVDIEVRNQNSLKKRCFTKYIFSNQNPNVRQSKFSHIYDYQISHHLFEFLLKTLLEYFKVDAKKIRKKTGLILHEAYGSQYSIFFPETVFEYPNQAFPNNQSFLVDTKKKPQWR